MQIHVVQEGDTLWRLAQMYGTSIEQILYVNQLEDGNVLAVGEALIIPTPFFEYVVQPGDRLSFIAQKHGVRVEEITEFNQLTNPDLLYVGELLHMPYVYHQIQSGESLWHIAKRFGVKLEDVIKINNIQDPSLIYIGQSIKIPNIVRPKTEVNAYTTTFSEQGQHEILALGRYFTFLTPFSYNINEDGTLTTMTDALVLEAAMQTNVMPLLVLTNFRNRRFDSDLVATILRDVELQNTLIANILTVMKEKGYRGINIDFEYVYPEDRENYNMFLRRIVDQLHTEGFIVSTALAPKESAEQKGLLYEAHDYKAHGEIVDFVVLMTYEWGWAGGSPLAIAPINKVRDVLNYAVTDIPRDKIMLGIPLYGRDWKIPWIQGTFARTISPQEAIFLTKKYQVEIQYHSTYQSPFFRYVDETGQQHEVWFEDARSVQVKFDTIKAYKLRGASFWVLGSPFPQNWPVLGNNFSIEKK